MKRVSKSGSSFKRMQGRCRRKLDGFIVMARNGQKQSYREPISGVHVRYNIEDVPFQEEAVTGLHDNVVIPMYKKMTKRVWDISPK